MVCKLFYVSEYINGCNISQFGEGCEKCVPLFKSSLMISIIVLGICALALWFIIKYIIKPYQIENKK